MPRSDGVAHLLTSVTCGEDYIRRSGKDSVEIVKHRSKQWLALPGVHALLRRQCDLTHTGAFATTENDD